jgi:hypothetical protein
MWIRIRNTENNQRCGSVTFWYGSGCGSGSSDPYLCPTDPEADPGGPKTDGSGSGTLVKSHKDVCHKTVDLEIKGLVFLTVFA